ncbi:DUF3857 and transglutaminase domain-containing protein [bacterium]|nr:DUF3857 and transglutaminase domain-containing protein [bacterium]
MKKILIFSSLFIIFSLISGEQIWLKDGSSLETSIKFFRDSVFFLSTGDSLLQTEVSEILYGGSGETKYHVGNGQDFWDLQYIMDMIKPAKLDYPDAGGIIILDEGLEKLHNDGKRSYRYHFIGMILKPEMTYWGENSLYFEEGRSTVKIGGGRTIKPDGTIYYLEEDMVKVTMPVEGMEFMDQDKYLSFTLPEVQKGDIIEYYYERNTYNPYDHRVFEPSYYFQSSEPVLISRFTVEIPETLELNYIAKNFPEGGGEPLVRISEGMKMYQWELRRIPPLIREEYMPGEIDIVPGVYASLFGSWDYLFEWESKLNLRRMEVTPEIEQQALRITRGLDRVDDQIAAIYHWIQRNIRYVSIKGGVGSGLCGHSASTTLENKFGDCIDKSTLFASMLQALGIQAYPVGILTNDNGQPPWDIPNVYANHAITEIHLNDTFFFLDPTSSDHRFPYFSGDDHGTLVTNPILGEIHSTPIPEPDDNMRSYQIDVVLKSSGDAVIDYSSTYTGDWEAWIRGFWRDIPRSEWENQISEMISADHPEAQLLEYEISNPERLDKQFGLSWKYRIRNLSLIARDLMVFRIPDLRQYSFPEVATRERKYNIEYATSYGLKQNAKVEIPLNTSVRFVPPEINIECPYASYQAGYRVEDNFIIYSDSFKRYARRIPADYYLEYKAFLNQISRYSKYKIVLQKTF